MSFPLPVSILLFGPFPAFRIWVESSWKSLHSKKPRNCETCVLRESSTSFWHFPRWWGGLACKKHSESIPQYSKSPPYKPPSCEHSKVQTCPCMPAVVLYYCTFQSADYKIKNIFCIFCVHLFFMSHLYKKCYEPSTVQYYTVNCVSWISRLTLLDLRANWT